MKAELPHLRAAASAANVADARAEAKAVARDAHRARFYTSGPVWAVLAHVPYFGRPVESARGLTRAADRLGTKVVPNLIDISDRVEPAETSLAGQQV